ncbi:MAG: hypothetical protein HY459_04045 [Parcubacteria group bacterium]|nr:hypothetical protein [Parcubacteria group bacterium]
MSFIILAGWEKAIADFIIFPLQNYTAINSYPLSPLYLPLIIIVAFELVLFFVLGRRLPLPLQRLSFLPVTSFSLLISVLYLPDYIHIAFVLPFIVLTALVLAPTSFSLVIGSFAKGKLEKVSHAFLYVIPHILLAGFLIGFLALSSIWFLYEQSIIIPTPRGSISYYPSAPTFRVLTAHRALLAFLIEHPYDSFFIFPFVERFLFLTDHRNPVPYPLIHPGFLSEKRLEEVVQALTEKKPRFAVYFPQGNSWPYDRDNIVEQYIRSHYTVYKEYYLPGDAEIWISKEAAMPTL